MIGGMNFVRKWARPDAMRRDAAALVQMPVTGEQAVPRVPSAWTLQGDLDGGIHVEMVPYSPPVRM